MIKKQSQTSTISCSSVLTANKSHQKRVRASTKIKLLISPSKDLIAFFGNTAFNNLNSIKCNKKQSKNAKLKLCRKQHQQNQSCQQKNILQQIKKQENTLSATNSTESFHSHQTLNVEHQKCQKLKKQVDQIRRKYSCGKMKQSFNINRINSSQEIRISAQNNSLCSLNSQKLKMSFLTPKNDRCLGKGILTKNVFSKDSTHFRINRIQINKNLKINSFESDKSTPKCNFQLQNIDSSVSLNHQIKNTDDKKPFQFTFGRIEMRNHRKEQELQLPNY